MWLCGVLNFRLIFAYHAKLRMMPYVFKLDCLTKGFSFHLRWARRIENDLLPLSSVVSDGGHMGQACQVRQVASDGTYMWIVWGGASFHCLLWISCASGLSVLNAVTPFWAAMGLESQESGGMLHLFTGPLRISFNLCLGPAAISSCARVWNRVSDSLARE